MKALELAKWHQAMADEPKRAEYKRTKHSQTAAELRRLAEVNAELLGALDIALQFMRIASDWNIDEAEINGEMRSTYDLIEMVEAPVAKAKEQQ